MVKLTPYSRDEFDESFITDDDPLEQARRTIYWAAATHSTTGATGFRCNTTRPGSIPAHDWANMPDILEQVTERLRGVVVEHDAAVDVMLRYDGNDTLHYVDPPYVHDTRSKTGIGSYRHEMTDDNHRELAAVLHGLQGMVIVSGYACPLYDNELFPDWHRVERETFADGARARTEVLWMKNVPVQNSFF
jgi:DNA adenine methylase